MGETVLYAADGKVGIVTLNRPEKLNALTMEMRLAVEAVLRRADADEATSVIVLRAEGRSFCVGFDVGGGHPQPWRHDALKYHERLSRSFQALMTPWTLRKPVIASVQGHALGGGCELAMFCDLTIAAEDAQFGEPEVLFSQVGPAVLMPFIIGHKRARELIYFGDRIDAKRALEIGMINRVVPAAELETFVKNYADTISGNAPLTVHAVKVTVGEAVKEDAQRNIALTNELVQKCYASNDYREGRKAFMEKRKPAFTGT